MPNYWTIYMYSPLLRFDDSLWFNSLMAMKIILKGLKRQGPEYHQEPPNEPPPYMKFFFFFFLKYYEVIIY